MSPRATVALVRRISLLGLLVLAACTSGAPGSTATTGPGAADTTDPTAPTDGAPTGTTDACIGTSDCDTDGICVADYAPLDPPPGGMRGPADCAPKSACIGQLDLGRWCFDHRGCCDDLRCRPTDGLCEPATLGQTTGATEAPDTDTGSTTDVTTTDVTTTDATTGSTTDATTDASTSEPGTTGTTG